MTCYLNLILWFIKKSQKIVCLNSQHNEDIESGWWRELNTRRKSFSITSKTSEKSAHFFSYAYLTNRSTLPPYQYAAYLICALFFLQSLLTTLGPLIKATKSVCRGEGGRWLIFNHRFSQIC